MSVCGLSCIRSMTSLLSAQSSLKSVNSVRSVQTQLETEAEIYKPDMAIGFAGDPEKADALTKRAQNLNGNVDRICFKVQTGVQGAAQDAASAKPQSKEADDQGDSLKMGNDKSSESAQSAPAGLIYDSGGKAMPIESVRKTMPDQAISPLHRHLDQII